MTRNSRLNSLSATKNKRLLFKVVKTNWTYNNRPFLDTQSYRLCTRRISKGPKTYPCGTPNRRRSFCEIWVLTCVVWRRSFRCNENQSLTIPRIPWCSSFCNKTECQRINLGQWKYHRRSQCSAEFCWQYQWVLALHFSRYPCSILYVYEKKIFGVCTSFSMMRSKIDRREIGL